MTYETGTATDLEDLLAKLSTFAVTTHGGWTAGYSPNPNTTNGWFELHKGSLSFGARYDVGATPLHIGIYQASAYVDTVTAPGAHTGDSGNGWNDAGTGQTNAQLLTERCVRDIGNGPFASYHFFADDSDNDYIHVVVEPTSGMFRHFGFGTLDRFGDGWTGGEYVYGHYWDTATNANLSDGDHVVFLDGLGIATGVRVRGATVRIGGSLLNIGAAVWGVSGPVASASLLTDTAGNVRRQIHGGFRAGIGARGFGNVVGSFSSGFVPLQSISAYYRDPSNPRVQLLGYMPDIRSINVRNFSAAQEVTVGGETWVVFPLSIKSTAAVANRSLFGGVAYRKVA